MSRILVTVLDAKTWIAVYYDAEEEPQYRAELHVARHEPQAVRHQDPEQAARLVLAGTEHARHGSRIAHLLRQTRVPGDDG